MQTVTSSGVLGVGSGCCLLWLESLCTIHPSFVRARYVSLFLDSNGWGELSKAVWSWLSCVNSPLNDIPGVELSKAVWSWLSCFNSPLNDIPGVLCYVHIVWRACGTVFRDDVGLFVGCDDSGVMACGVAILHKDEVLGS